MIDRVIDPIETLRARYEEALRAYLAGAGESALQEAYDLGRKAMAKGLGALDLARIHQMSLVKAIEEIESPDGSKHLIEHASVFFTEGLATFEMTHRGFQEAIAALSTRTAELEAVNRNLGQEIDRRQHIQDDLQQSEERYRNLVEKALDVIYTLSTEGTIASLNPAFETITGFKCKDWLGKPFLPIVHPDDAARCMDIYKRLLSGKTPPTYELKVLSKSGEYIIGEFTTTPQFHRGTVVGVLGVARDITKRRKAEEQLRTSQLRLAEAQQLAHLGNWEWDLATGGLAWSKELYSIFGVDPSHYAPTYETFLNLIHHDDREMVSNIIQEAMKDHKPFSFYHRLVRQDGMVRILHSRGIVVGDEQGNALKMFGTGQDVTEVKQAEMALRDLPNRILHAQEVERRRLARELHDDVCQRLSGMKLSIDVLENEFPRDRKIIRSIDGAKAQIDHIITDIRRISWNLRPATLDDLGLIAAVGKFTSDLRSTYKLTVRFHASKAIPQHFDADMEIAVYRIVQEAAMNAIKHANPTRILVSLKRLDGKLVVSISDDGKGFDVTKIHDKGPEHGFGIMSMEERANLLQGKFHVDSAPSQGTKITVELPLRREDADKAT